MKLSIVVPCYNEEESLPMFYSVTMKVLEGMDCSYEFVFVDDGSRDRTWAEIETLSDDDASVRGVHFSRNFGKEAALMAGLSESTGDCCVVLDCDLQHPPEKIPEMYSLWLDGYEIVEGVKSSRGQESALHRFAAHTFYSLISAATGFDMSSASDFKLLDRKAIDVLVGMQEKNAFFRALSSWIGFKTTTVTFDVQERMAGESKWSTAALTKYALRNITSFSTAPMQIVTFLGGVMLLVSVVMGIVALVQKIAGVALGGFTTVIILQLFSSSIIMISIGILGYYIARIFEEVKNRPMYIISKLCGGEKNDERPDC
ncbi:MAG: glycosyltransferase family 2 protein [Clostridiales bacterium]|nr:glycosyltransferase family 2 protein [Clostridiales bacterium]